MSWSSEPSEIRAGDDVYGSDGDKVGTVAAVYPSYIVVEKGLFFPTDYYIPLSAVANYEDNQVFLNVAKDAALQRGWETQPVDLETGAVGTSTGVLTDTDFTASRAESDEEIRIPVMEEELTATVRQQEAGVVRIEKDVITEQRTLEVPVTEERVRVERRVVDRAVTGADAGAFEETVIEVPLMSETVDVQKEARVTGEVVVSKEAVQRTEQVTDTVRREEVYVDEDAAVIDDSEGSAPRRP